MKIRDMFKNTNGEVVEICEVDEVRKTCMIEFENGRTKQLSFSTLKDKRRWTPVEQEEKLVPMPGAEKLEDLKKANNIAKASKLADAVAKKSSKKNLIEYNGKALTLHGWAKELNVPFGTLYARVTRFNWTYEEALSGKKNK